MKCKLLNHRMYHRNIYSEKDWKGWIFIRFEIKKKKKINLANFLHFLRSYLSAASKFAKIWFHNFNLWSSDQKRNVNWCCDSNCIILIYYTPLHTWEIGRIFLKRFSVDPPAGLGKFMETHLSPQRIDPDWL